MGDLQFIEVNTFAASRSKLDNGNKKLVRAHAMRHFRQQQRTKAVPDLEPQALPEANIARKRLVPPRPSKKPRSRASDQKLASVLRFDTHDLETTELEDFQYTNSDSWSVKNDEIKKKCHRLEQPCSTPDSESDLNLSQDYPAQISPLTFSDASDSGSSCNEYSTIAYMQPAAVLRSPTIMRQQLKADFLDYYVPQDTPVAHWLTEKFDRWFDERSKSMTTASNAILLLHRANVAKDGHLAKMGQQMHAQAVSYLQIQLSRPDAAYDDTVLCTIASLAVCCRIRSFGSNEGDDMHYKGLMALLKYRGPKALTSDFAADLILTFMPRALTLAVEQRTPFIFGTPEWQDALKDRCQDSPIKRIVLISCRIPNALAKVDPFLRSGTRDQTINLTSVISELCDIDASLGDFQSWYTRTSAKPRYGTVPLEERFSSFVEEFVQYPQPYPYASVYEFYDPLDAIYHGWYWVALWGVRRAIVDLTKLLRSEQSVGSDGSWSEWQVNLTNDQWHTNITRECLEIGDHILSIIPYIYSEPSVRRFRVSMRSQLYTARQCFEFAGSRRKMNWCDVLLEDLDREERTNHATCENASIDQVFSGWLMLV